MKTLAILLGLVLVGVYAVTEIEISGTDTVPAGPNTEVDGTVVEATQTQTQHRQKSSQTVAGQLLPSFCPYPDQTYPASCGWNAGNQAASSQEDCMRLCKALENCDRVKFNLANQDCALNTKTDDPATCLVSSGLSADPGWTLLVRLVAEDGGVCPGGVGPIGLPEDDFVSKFCRMDGKSCDTSGAYLSKYKATVFQCKTECNSQVACASAVHVVPDDSSSGKRMCHLMTTHCDTLVDESSGVSTTTLYRMNRQESDTRKAALAADPTDVNAGCPPGSVFFDKEPVTFTDKFCIVAKTGFCPGNEGRMYKSWQNFEGTAEGCMNKCAAYPTCAGIEFNLSRQAKNQNTCNMRDRNMCSPNDVIQSPGGDEGEVRIRISIPEGADATAAADYKCPVGTNPTGDSTDWSAKFCITYDRVCPESAVARISVGAATDLTDCLTQCRNADGCESASFQGGLCELLAGTCTTEQLEISIFKRYYFSIETSQPCPPIDCPANSTPQQTSVCPNTCANPTASNECDIETYRCVCTDGYLEHQNECIREDECPANECPERAPGQPALVSDGTSAQVWRVMEFTEDEATQGVDCGVGAVVKKLKPCPNTCESPDAQNLCSITEMIPSCHCVDVAQVWDGNTCRDANTCAT